MGFLKSIVRHSVGIACELLTLRDPFEQYTGPSLTGTRLDECGRTVLQVRADSYRDVDRFTEGTTPAGNVTEVHTHIGPHRWEIHFQDNDTDFREYLHENGIPLDGGE